MNAETVVWALDHKATAGIWCLVLLELLHEQLNISTRNVILEGVCSLDPTNISMRCYVQPQTKRFRKKVQF